jgi:thioredoxin 1
MSREDIEVAALQDLIQEHPLVFAYFWAPWCAPCQQFSPAYEGIAAQFPSICFTKINIEKQKSVADYFGILSIPYLLIFRQGLVVYAQAGNSTATFLENLARQALEKSDWCLCERSEAIQGSF